MRTFEEFLMCLYDYLIGTEDINNNMIKKHTKNLHKFGELSFNVKLPQLKEGLRTPDFDEKFIESFMIETKFWKLQISKCNLIDNIYYLHLDRMSTFTRVIYEILQEKSSYGSQKFKLIENIQVNTDYDIETNLSLTQLRIVLIKNVIMKLLKFNNCCNTDVDAEDIYLTHKSNNRNCGRIILCAPVQCICDNKNTEILAQDFYKKRSVDMRLMAEHKYGLRVISNPGWQEMFTKLGEAAVAIELLQIKVNRPVVCKLNDPASCSKDCHRIKFSKNYGITFEHNLNRAFELSTSVFWNEILRASFILYNFARICTLLREFQKKVDAKVYPSLPEFEEANFTLLTQEEEWELLYLHLLQFPFVVQKCLKGISENNIKIHSLCKALASMCLTFSVYYQRVRILTEPRDHLFATLHARIHLVNCIKIVLENGLSLLNIEPITQM